MCGEGQVCDSVCGGGGGSGADHHPHTTCVCGDRKCHKGKEGSGADHHPHTTQEVPQEPHSRHSRQCKHNPAIASIIQQYLLSVCLYIHEMPECLSEVSLPMTSVFLRVVHTVLWDYPGGRKCRVQ